MSASLHRLIFLIPALILAYAPAHAQQSPTPSPTPIDIIHYPNVYIWTPPMALPNGENYAVDLNKVCSISLQKYVSRTLGLMNGSTYTPLLGSPTDLGKDQKTVFHYADVTELTIETLGGIPARFYSLKEHKERDMQVSVLGSDVTDDLKEKREELQKLQQSILSVTNAPGQQDKAEEAKASQATIVMKDYPVTTHAKNLEFRLASDAAVTSLYQDIFNKWKARRP